MYNDTRRAFSSVAIVLAIGAIGGMALVGAAATPRAAATPIVITLAAPAPVAAAPVAAAPAPVAAAPVKAAPVAAAPVKRKVRKAPAPAPVAHVVYLVPRWHGCTCSM